MVLFVYNQGESVRSLLYTLKYKESEKEKEGEIKERDTHPNQVLFQPLLYSGIIFSIVVCGLHR